MTDNPNRGKVAQTESHFGADHVDYTMTTFKHNGDVDRIWIPSQFSIHIDSNDSTAMAFKDVKGVVSWDTIDGQDQAQAVLNAIHARESQTFYLDGRIADRDGKFIKGANE